MMASPHSVKEINFTNLDDVKIDSISEGLYCGRRFRINDSEEGVIFNDLFRKARRLAARAHSPDELAKLKAFIGKLRKVELGAAQEYNDKDCLYKFKSWFHRLLGGAFFGSHLDRLDSLEKRVEKRLSKGELNAADILTKNYTLLKSYLTQYGSLSIGAYRMGYDDDSDSFYLREGLFGPKLEVSFTNWEIASMEYKGQPIEEIPVKFAVVLDKGLSEICKKTSRYEDFWENKAHVIKVGLTQVPLWHLAQFCKLDKGYCFRVDFLNDDFEYGAASDAGGLRQDYLTDLVKGLQNQKTLFTEVSGGLKLPRLMGQVDQVIPDCNRKEKEVYTHLGMLMGWSAQYNFITGRYFSDSLFEAMSVFTRADTQSSFQHLNRQVHVDIAKVFLKAHDQKLSNLNERLIQCLDLVEEANLIACIDANDTKSLINAIYQAGVDQYLDEDGNPKMEEMRANSKAICNQLFNAIFKDPYLIEELNGASLGSLLAPIHCIAQGIEKEYEWQYFLNLANQSSRIQGVIDREYIITRINGWGSKAKIQWLKEWISDNENGATEEDLKSFLKFVTGAPSLGQGATIGIGYGYSSRPVGHTCSKRLDISPNLGPEHADGTKDGFIACLKESIACTGFQIT